MVEAVERGGCRTVVVVGGGTRWEVVEGSVGVGGGVCVGGAVGARWEV